MKPLGDSKGSLTPPLESDKMNSTPSLIKIGGGDKSNSSVQKPIARSKSYENDFVEPLELNNGESIYLDFLEDGHSSFVLEGINKLRKQGQFCDIILVVDDHELQVHRAVLAACSPYLFDFFSGLEETTEPLPTYKLKNIPFVGFHYLLDYMYTGRLHVPLENVPAVYATALVLKMETASKICAGFLSNHLTTANCLGMYKIVFLKIHSHINTEESELESEVQKTEESEHLSTDSTALCDSESFRIRRFTKDLAFRQAVDEYIRLNLKDIMQSKSFFGLTDLQVEVVGLDESITNEVMERRFFSLVLDWAKENLNDLKPKMERLVEKVNVLYLQSDNTLKDCAEVEDTVLSSEDDMVQDYKKARRRDKFKTKGSNSCATNGNGQAFHKFNLNPEEAVSVAEREWSIVATRKTNENAYLAIAVLDGRLMAITVHVRPPVPPAGSESKEGSVAPDSPPAASNSKNRLSPVMRKASIIPLQPMSTPRCALGAVELDGKLVVCGGYDRGECLKSVESFTIKDNQWTKMPDMNRARGRFGAAVLNGAIYVCGGSDGWKELSCVEKYDPAAQKWKYVCNMQKERSSHSVVTLNDKLYCIGGCEGQRSITTCEAYDLVSNTWSRVANLITARSQACVCAAGGLLYAVGGTDLWNTLSSVEAYDPVANTWTPRASLNSPRRGAGVGLVDGLMIVVGGSDGTQSLVSSELYDFETNTWSVGPSLISPRANLSVVSIERRLFAVGGFSGKKFLSTIEWLDQDDLEWFGHAPKRASDTTLHSWTQQQGVNGEAAAVQNGDSQEAGSIVEVPKEETTQKENVIQGSSELNSVSEQNGTS